ncbi:hypothetical protein J1D01_12380 [Seonamhaeicola sp. NFXS20]|uniref:hypothetical protein n=1 Tax=unclassified Seonamhaeicola TaxID=2622645 RepID=UPI003566BFC8
MKTIKLPFVLAILLSLNVTFLSAQQAFQIHQDNVKPSKASEYEKIAKEFNEASIEYNLQTSWVTAMRDDFTYYYISPIENFAELDKNPFEDMAKAMGDKFGEMFENFDKCYDSHGTYLLYKVDELSYKAPEGTDVSDQNYRKWILMYYKPKNGSKIKEGLKAVKDMFISKESKEYYNVYQSGFGTMENYYLISVPAKDEVEGVQRAKANQDVLGPDRYETFNKVIKYVEKMEEYSGWIRPDLSYSPK